MQITTREAGNGKRKGSRLTKLEENKNDYLLENQKNI